MNINEKLVKKIEEEIKYQTGSSEKLVAIQYLKSVSRMRGTGYRNDIYAVATESGKAYYVTEVRYKWPLDYKNPHGYVVEPWRGR